MYHNMALTNGVFDILHVGHIRSLRAAYDLGFDVYVLINSDSSAAKLKPGRPIVTQEERQELLLSLKYVTWVTIFDELTPDNMIKTLKPGMYFKGHDYTVNTIPEKALVESYGGKVMVLGDPKDHSTTDIINKIKKI